MGVKLGRLPYGETYRRLLVCLISGVLKRTFGPARYEVTELCRKLHNVKLQNFRTSEFVLFFIPQNLVMSPERGSTPRQTDWSSVVT
jgi:hypothetical protein